MRNAWAAIVAILVVATFVSADPPRGYYSTAEGKTGPELKAALHATIDGHKVLPYRDVWRALVYTDSACPDGQPGCERVRLLYLDDVRSIHQANDKRLKKGDCVPHDSWEREHVWPASRGFKQESRDGYTDLHHLRPADRNMNRAHWYYGYDMGGETVMDKTVDGKEVPTKAKLDKVNTSFEPPDHAKGQVARMIFYMAVRYEEGDLDPPEKMPDLYLRDENRRVSEPWIGDLCTLIAWNNQFRPTDFERGRNDRVMDKQGNRNPFIDHPDWANLIWGPKCPQAE